MSKTVRILSCRRRFSCNICGKIFISKHLLDQHVLSHLRVCQVCGSKFRHEKDLKRHLLSEDDDKFYKCCFCGKTFKSLRGCKGHGKRHTGQWAVRCFICSKGFPTHSAYRRHAVVHTKEKPFKCPLCDAKFSLEGNLHSHLRRYHGGNDNPSRHRSVSRHKVRISTPTESIVSFPSSSETDTSETEENGSNDSKVSGSGSKAPVTESDKSSRQRRKRKETKARGTQTKESCVHTYSADSKAKSTAIDINEPCCSKTLQSEYDFETEPYTMAEQEKTETGHVSSSQNVSPASKSKPQHGAREENEPRSEEHSEFLDSTTGSGDFASFLSQKTPETSDVISTGETVESIQEDLSGLRLVSEVVETNKNDYTYSITCEGLIIEPDGLIALSEPQVPEVAALVTLPEEPPVALQAILSAFDIEGSENSHQSESDPENLITDFGDLMSFLEHKKKRD